jgi:hypothetical protein
MYRLSLNQAIRVADGRVESSVGSNSVVHCDSSLPICFATTLIYELLFKIRLYLNTEGPSIPSSPISHPTSLHPWIPTKHDRNHG